MIKMRVNGDSSSRCDECGATWRNTAEMYDLFIFGEVHTICHKCSETLFSKTLKASCMYNAKVKRKEDFERAERENRRR